MKPISICFAIVFLLTSSSSHAKNNAFSSALQAISPCECFFVPPAGWEFADPKTLAPMVKIAFLKKSSKGFCASINLAVEETSASLNDYLKAVKAIHEQDRANQWRALGKVSTAAGLAQLTEIDTTSDFGPVRILQAILVKEGRAYVLTAAALREEISAYYKDFQSAFRSLTLTSDLMSNIPQLERREALKLKQNQLVDALANAAFDSPDFQEKHWLPFQKTVIDDFADMGAFWQVLLLRATLEKANPTQPQSNE